MCRLPPELVDYIFQLIEQELGGRPLFHGYFGNYTIYKAFYFNAALVCKTWYALIKKQEMTVYIDGEEILTSLYRNVCSGSSYNIRHLHVMRDRDRYIAEFPLYLIEPLAGKLPKILGDSPRLRSLCLPAACLLLPPCQAGFFKRLVSNTPFVQLIGCWDQDECRYDQLDWSSATYLRTTDVPKKISFYDVQVSFAQVELSNIFPSPCTTLEIDGGDAVFSATDLLSWDMLFPKLTLLDISDISSSTLSWLSLRGRASNLQHLEIRAGWNYDREYYEAGYQKPTITLITASDLLLSPNLTRLVIERDPAAERQNEDDLYRCTPFEIPGFDMPALQYLRIGNAYCENSLESLVNLCDSFRDPLFCPKIATLPSIGIPSDQWLQGGQNLNLIRVTPAHRYRIARGLAGFQARGIKADPDIVENSLWRFALTPSDWEETFQGLVDYELGCLDCARVIYPGEAHACQAHLTNVVF